ncbi:MAG: hypothetical protein RR512_07565 [Coprobacillus sp.]
MAKSKIINMNKKIENIVVDGYQKIETKVLDNFTKLEDRFVDNYLTYDNESVEEAKKRLYDENKQRMIEKERGKR